MVPVQPKLHKGSNRLVSYLESIVGEVNDSIDLEIIRKLTSLTFHLHLLARSCEEARDSPALADRATH